VQRRHAEYYRDLAGQADRPLRGAGQGEWLERLEAEAGNLAAAVTWYLANDRVPLPHLFRILFLFWFLRDRQAEACPWVDQLLPAADSLDSQAQAELASTAAVMANEVGDDAAELAARRRLESLLAEIQDPLLHAVGQLVMAWTSPTTGDFDGALKEVSASLAELRGQDEPFFTAMAAFTAGAAETALGRPDGALQHLAVMRDLADRFDYTWLTASAQLQLGGLAIRQGRLDQARELLDEALDLSLAIRIIRNVTLCLAAFAHLAFAEGDPERAALLAGAAEGLRRRAGFSTWPMLRQGEAELAAQIRQALGDDRFGRHPGPARKPRPAALSHGGRYDGQQPTAKEGRLVSNQQGAGCRGVGGPGCRVHSSAAHPLSSAAPARHGPPVTARPSVHGPSGT